MKRPVLITIILFTTLLLKAQLTVTDSLSKILQERKEDTSLVLRLFEASFQVGFSNPDSAYLLALKGIRLAKQINYLRGELYCKVAAAGCTWVLGDYSSAVRLLLPEVRKAELTNDPRLLLFLYAILSNSYRDQQDFTEALKYSFKGYPIMFKYDNCSFCKIYIAATAYIFLEKGELDSARYYLQKALDYPPSHGNDGWINSVAGRIYTGLKSYDSAFIFYRKSFPILRDIDNLKDLAGAYNNTAALFLIIKQKDSALAYALKSLAVSQEKRFAKENMEASLIMSNIYEKTNADSSYYYYRRAMAAKDSLYNQEKQRQILSYKFSEELLQQEIEDKQIRRQNQVKIYSLLGLMGFVLIIAFLLFRNNKQKQKAYSQLQKQKTETDAQKIKAEGALEELKATQAQLIQSEKMASLGELTAGIAHEIQNPLNFVNNFSEVNAELINELKNELRSGNKEEAISIADSIQANDQKIINHGKRADAIVKGMLQHSRTSSGQKELTDINALADEYLHLAYHGFRAKDKSFNATLKTDYDKTIGNISVIPQDIGRVILNLITNAFYAVTEKKKQNIEGYEPTIMVSTRSAKLPSGGRGIEISVRDNGNGIDQVAMDKIFQPFFTTKPAGQGTGLGLSLSYDIIKAHGGELKVKTREGEFAEFIIHLPV